MAVAANQLVDKLIGALSTEASIDASRLADAIERGFARGLNPVRSVLESGVGLDVLERVAWWHQGYDVAEIDVNAIDPSFFNKFPVSIAKAYNALPLGQGSEGFLIAVADPDNLTVLDDIRKRFAPTPVKVLVADAQQIEAALSSMEHRASAPS